MAMRVGVIGLGFMGRAHVGAYARLDSCRIVALSDPRIDAIRSGQGTANGNLKTGAGEWPVDWKAVRPFTDAGALLRDPEIDAVSICTPTHTHAELTRAALAAGKHVLVEKPLAVSEREVEEVAAAARRAGRLCMPAMVMRFWPGWAWLRERIADGTLGQLKALQLERLGSRPAWNKEFYEDDAKTGGALVDLHIHDADFVVHALGMPARVSSVGTLTQVSTQYSFAERPDVVVTAVGGWAQQASFGFRMRYLASFERATAEFDLAFGDQPVRVHDRDGSRPAAVPVESAYDAEVWHFVRAVEAWPQPLEGTPGPEDAIRVARVLKAERQSLMEGAAVAVRSGD